jgi:hypothetical protein
LRKTQLSPSYSRKPDFKSHESTDKEYKFSCAHCGQPICVAYAALINRGVGWEQDLGTQLAADAREFYRIGVVGKSQDGGWPSMIRVQCSNCNTGHLLYAGVNEVRNSVYFVTVQGIAEIIDETH